MKGQAGFDLGSRYVKIVIADDNIKYMRFDTITFYKKYVARTENGIAIDTKSLNIPENYKITATGYGRNLMPEGNAEIISEIKAHFKGVLNTLNYSDFILIDIGGQDSKVIWAKNGFMENFVMNDKCAASTGRFIENAGNALGMSVEKISIMKDNPVNLSSTCAVFCESEIIGLLASGVEEERIAAGINLSIAKRLAPLVKMYSSPNIIASGGAAENAALLYFLAQLIGQDITPAANPQFNGAIGCIDKQFVKSKSSN